LKEHVARQIPVEFSPDGKKLAFYSCKATATLWDIHTGTALHSLHEDNHWVRIITPSPNNEYLAFLLDETKIQIRRTSSCAILESIDDTGVVFGLSFSTDSNKRIIVSSVGDIKLMDIITGSISHVSGNLDLSVEAVAFSSNGKHITLAGWGKGIRLLDMDTGETLDTLESDFTRVTSLAFSHDGMRLAIASERDYVTDNCSVWNICTGIEMQAAGITEIVVQSLENSSASTELVAFSPADDKLVSMSRRDGITKLCDINREIALHTLPCYGVSAVAFLSGAKELAVASLEHYIAIWDSSPGVLVRTGKPDFELRTTAFTTSSTMVASVSKDYMIRLWDIETQEVMQTFNGHSGTIHAMAFSPCNKKLASASSDQTIRLWHTDKGVTSQTIGAHFRPSKSTLGRMKNATHEGEPPSIRSHVSAISNISFSSDGKRLATSCAGMANIWDVRTVKTLQTMEDGGARRHGSYESTIFSPDGQYLAFSSPTGQIKIHNTNTGEVLKTLEKDKDYIHPIAYSPNGSRLATLGSYPQISVWNTETWTILRTTYFPTYNVRNTAFSLDSKLLVLTRDDEQSQVWDCSADLWSYPVMHTSITTYPGDSKF
jgi:WD40 repeat protein